MEFLFPMVVEERTLAAADAWLADDHEGPASLRRLVSEGRDGIARALWARKRDAAAADQG